MLKRFGTEPRRARRQYLSFVADGVDRGRRPEFQGGGLIRSAGGREAVRLLRRGREGYGADERILGGSEFVERLRSEIENEDGPGEASRRAVSLRLLIERVCQAEGVGVESVEGEGRIFGWSGQVVAGGSWENHGLSGRSPCTERRDEAVVTPGAGSRSWNRDKP